MAAVKHLYMGHGDPNDNPDLELAGDAVGNHLYEDLDGTGSVWISRVYEDGGVTLHAGWERLLAEADLPIVDATVNDPIFDGKMGLYTDNGTRKLAIAMYDPETDSVRWTETNVEIGGLLSAQA